MTPPRCRPHSRARPPRASRSRCDWRDAEIATESGRPHSWAKGIGGPGPRTVLCHRFEPPSAGLRLNWELLGALRKRGVALASLTHAAGLSSTGDAVVDALLPLPE